MRWTWLIILFHLVGSVSAKSLALLIGNGGYQHCPKLANPTRDVKVMASSLAAGGYEVTQLNNATLQDMTKGLARFCEEAGGAERLLVFFAGHGVEVEGTNYLIPVEAKVAQKGDQKWETLSLNTILRELATVEAKVKMVVLDCCRDDPFAGGDRAWRAKRSTQGGGMAAVGVEQLSRGMVVVYSGKPGQTVPDGPKGGNSPFVSAWQREIQRAAGKSVLKVFADMGDFLPEKNKHWIKQDADGSTLALLSNVSFLAVKPGADSTEVREPVVPRVIVQPTPPQFSHHSRSQPSLFYKGEFEGSDAYFSLSWHSPHRFSGYCFLLEGETVYYIDGNQTNRGKMLWSLWSKGREIRSVTLAQNTDLKSKSQWRGKTNIGTLSFQQASQTPSSYKAKASYRGHFGVQQATVELQWKDSAAVLGKLKLEGGKVWALVGDNSFKGTLFANLYSETDHVGVVLLKRSSFQGVSWVGRCHLNTGQQAILSVKR